MIFTYNKEFVGDVLMVIVANNEDAKLSVERKGNIARIFREDTAETVAWNIFQVFLISNKVARSFLLTKRLPCSTKSWLKKAFLKL